MKKHRFIGNFDLTKKKAITTDVEIINQLKNVLRLKAGELFLISDGQGREANAQIVVLQNKLVEFEIEDAHRIDNEPSVTGTLYCSILKRENFELVVQKATEIGVKKIQPLTTARTVKLNLRDDRLKKIAKEAAEQSGRVIVPEICQPIKFELAVKKSIDNDVNFFFDQNISKEPPHDVRIVDTAGIFIGPEGGWTEQEQALAEHFRFHFANLGKLTLRAETAAIIASYLALYGGIIE
jgi:16S rRNA (uracil1498-N3)-methyltransferase